MPSEKIIIIGGNAAGMSAASKAKRENPELKVEVFEKQDSVSYGLCGLPYFISGKVKNAEDLIVKTPEEFEKNRNIKVNTNHRAIELDTKKKKVLLKKEKNEVIEKKYDKLLLSTGAEPIIPDFFDTSLENVFKLRWLEDSKKIKNFIKNNDPDSAIITSGYIGLEMAEAFRKLGIETIMVTKDNEILPNFCKEINEEAEKTLESKGVKIIKNSPIKKIRKNENRMRKVKTEKETISADMALLSLGIKPSTDLAKKSGIKTGKTDGIIVDEQMRTNKKGIYAAGDCVETNHIISGENVNIPLGDTANRQGRIAGANLAGENSKFPGVLGTSILKTFDKAIAKTGLNESEIKKSNLDYVSETIETKAKAGYYPQNSEIKIKMIAENPSGKLIGVQMIGKEGVSQRIDTAAALLHNEATLKDIEKMDLAYAPPFSPAWDPLQTAAKVVSKKL